MPKGKYNKVLLNKVSEGDHIIDSQGEIHKVVLERKKITKNIQSNKGFMKIYKRGSDIIYNLGEDAKYLGYIIQCTYPDHTINWRKFKKIINQRPDTLCKLKKRLIKKGLIFFEDNEFYINPAITSYKTVDADIWKLFEKVNSKYGIKEF